jgi:hypothetical protein
MNWYRMQDWDDFPKLGLPKERLVRNPDKDRGDSIYTAVPTPGLRVFVWGSGIDSMLRVEWVVAADIKPKKSLYVQWGNNHIEPISVPDPLAALAMIHHLVAEYKAGNLNG